MAHMAMGAAILSVFSLYLYILASNFPQSPGYNDFGVGIKFPSNLTELSALASLLSHYRQQYNGYVLLLFCSAYLYKQCFAIPGSVLMNLLAGALFGVPTAFPLCCVLTAFGASGCYLLSKHFGRQLVERFFSERLTFLQMKVKENMPSLFFYLLFLRMFPMSPNWFLNIASPLINVPLHLFFFSVLIGLMPYNFICVQTGAALSQVRSLQDIFTLSVMLKLALAACVSLLPGLLLRFFGQTKSKEKVEVKKIS